MATSISALSAGTGLLTRSTMDLYSIVQYVLFLAIVTVMVKPLGGYMERVFSRKTTLLDWFCVPIERLIYRVTAIDPTWK
jgi:K+-transporting ATPase ATPase A chain